MRTPRGRPRFLGGYLAAIAALVVIEKVAGNPDVYGFTVLFLGGLHVFYDGFDPKLRPERIGQPFEWSTPNSDFARSMQSCSTLSMYCCPS